MRERFPAGHYHSPIPDLNVCNKDLIWKRDPKIPGINMNVEKQLKFFNNFNKLSFEEEPSTQFRYFLKDNNYFGYYDALTLCNLLIYAKPKNVIEIGSGFTSAVMLDINEEYFKNSIDFTFIEPNPERLFSLKKETDNFKYINSEVQNVKIENFNILDKNDILVIDSSHVSKVGSDVNYEIHEILPSLRSGVYVFFHDVFGQFEYPREWIEDGFLWNEQYMLRAFLEFNSAYEIIFFGDYLHMFFNTEMDLKEQENALFQNLIIRRI